MGSCDTHTASAAGDAGICSSAHLLNALRRQLESTRDRSLELYPPKFMSSERHFETSIDAMSALHSKLPLHAKTLTSAMECYVCHSHALLHQNCKEGHAVCEKCDLGLREGDARCGMCRTPLLSVSVQPVVGMKDLCTEQKTYTCPLCTDTRKRSMLELLHHVGDGQCASVVGKTRTLSERSLRDTRDRWVDILCNALCGADAKGLVEDFMGSSQRKVCAERDEACDRAKELEQVVSKYKEESTRSSERWGAEKSRLLMMNTDMGKDITDKNREINNLKSEVEKLKRELHLSKENVRVLRGNIIDITCCQEYRAKRPRSSN
eukprot:gene3711-4651_t